MTPIPDLACEGATGRFERLNVKTLISLFILA
jgi:hypothetical protein